MQRDILGTFYCTQAYRGVRRSCFGLCNLAFYADETCLEPLPAVDGSLARATRGPWVETGEGGREESHCKQANALPDSFGAPVVSPPAQPAVCPAWYLDMPKDTQLGLLDMCFSACFSVSEWL